MANEVSIGTLTLGLEALTATFERDMAGVIKSMAKVDAAMKRVAKTATVSGAAVVAMGAKVSGAMAGIDPVLGKATAAAEELAAIFDKLRQSATASGAATKASAAQVARGIDGIGKAADRSIRPAKSLLDRFSISMDKAAAAIRPIGIAAARGRDALIDLGSNAVSVAGDFEAAMTRAAIVTGNLGEQGAKSFERLRSAAIDVASVTEFTSRQAAEGITLMGQAGFDTEEILAGLPRVLQLASAASVSVAKATDVAANTINAFGLSVEDDLERVNDVLIETANNSNTSFRLLASAMVPIAPIARNVGLEVEDTAALIGKLADAGIKGAAAGTSLRGILASMLNPSKAVKATMDELGVSFTTSDGKLKDFGQVINDLQPLVEDTGALFKIFGRRGGPAMAILLNEGSESIEAFGDKLRNSAGASALAAEANMATFQGRVAQLNSKLEAATIIIGDVIKDALLPLIDVLDATVQAFIDLPDFVQTGAVAIAAIATGVLALVAAFASLVGAIAAGASAIASLAAVKITLAAIASAAAVVGTAIVAIGAGILGAISILNQLHNIWLFFESDIKRGVQSISDAMAAIFEPAIDALMEAFGQVADWLMNLWDEIFEFIAGVAIASWDFITAAFMDSFGEAFDFLESLFVSATDSGIDVFAGMLDFIAGLIMAIIPNAWLDAFNDARVAFPDFLTELQIAGKNIIKVLDAAFKSVFDKAKSSIETIFDVFAAAAGFGLEVTGVLAGGEEQAGGGFFGRIGEDLVKSLGFDSLTDASDKLTKALASAKEEVEKAAVPGAPRRRTATAVAAGKAAESEAKKAERSQRKANATFDKLNSDRVKSATKAKGVEDDRFAKEKKQADKFAEAAKEFQDERLEALEEAKRKQEMLLQAWVDGLVSSLIDNLGEMGTVISSAIEGFQAGGIWGAVIGAVFELAKRTDGFQESVDDLSTVFDAAVEAVSPLTQAMVPLTSFINDILIDVFKALGFVFRFIGIVLSGIIILVLTIFKALADSWNGLLTKIEKFLSFLDIDLGRFRIQTGGLNDALEAAIDNMVDLTVGTQDVTEEQVKETEQLRELNEQLLNAPQGFKVSLERFNATVREGAAIGTGGIFTPQQAAGPGNIAGAVNIENVTVVTDDPETLFEEFERMTRWRKLRATGTSRDTGNTFQSSSEQRFAR